MSYHGRNVIDIMHLKTISYDLRTTNCYCQLLLPLLIPNSQLAGASHRSLAVTTPLYLADECTLVTATGHCPLWSADNRRCLVKRSRNQFGDRCFATTRPTLWNSLPEQLRQRDITFGQFKRSLKTFMFA